MPDAPKHANAIEVFYSYSHKDEDLRDELEKHLALLKREGIIKGWHDRRIYAGREWDGEINKYINSADMILLLVSSDFLASNYCYDVEVTRSMERHNGGESRVIPIILRACDWLSAPFGKLQALPKDALPVKKWPDPDEAFLNIAKGIREVASEIKSNQGKDVLLTSENAGNEISSSTRDSISINSTVRRDRDSRDIVERPTENLTSLEVCAPDMPNAQHEDQTKLADALNMIAASSVDPKRISVNDVAREINIHPATIIGALLTISLFGVIKLSDDHNHVSIPTEIAADFIRSLSLLIRCNNVIVEDWYRFGIDCVESDGLFEKGICLLGAFERRRLNEGNKTPIQRMEIVKAIIKAQTEDGTPSFLMLLNDKSNRYQFIGGSLRHGEKPEVAMHRELNEEISKVRWRKVVDYSIQSLSTSQYIDRFISPTYGVYTEYIIHYYYIRLFKQPVLGPSHRWISIAELSNGKTFDNISIVPPPDSIRGLLGELLELTPSIDTLASNGPHYDE